VRRALLSTLLACCLAGVAPAAAFGEPSWAHDSPVSEQSSGYLTCAGTSGGALDEVLPSIDYAEAFIDLAAAPPLGGVQLVRIQWFATGGDYCLEQGGTGAAIEIITPPGVELALDAENPALCGFDILQDASVCPVTTLPGDYGGTLLADARSGQPRLWPVTDGLNKTRLIVPVRLRRPVASFGRTAERRCNALPCPPDQSGDRVQFAVRFVPGAGGTPSAPLVSTVGLLGGSGGQNGSGGARLLARRPPARIRQARLRRGLTLRVRVPAGATARATLKSGSRVLASASRRARSAGTLTLRLKGRRRVLRALGRRTRSARLTVRVNAPGQASQRQTASIRVVP
jgi:hypothetical protein